MNNNEFAGNFIAEAEPIYVKRGIKKDGSISYAKRRQVELRCLNPSCNKEFVVDYSNAKRTKQKCCSNACSKKLVEKFEGGNEKHPLYIRWLAMKQRCLNPNSNNYIHYGARGITIADEFKDSFENYVNYLMSLPNCPSSFPSNKDVDRIDNDKGYERGNLRWVSRSSNILNQRKKTSKYGSKYTGVNWSITNNAWSVRVTYEGKHTYLGYFDNQEDAVTARNDFIIANGLPHKVQQLK